MAYGNGRFVASGGPGDVVVSNNGITKQRVLLPGPHEGYWIVALEFDGSRFLGISYGDGLLASARRPDL